MNMNMQRRIQAHTYTHVHSHAHTTTNTHAHACCYALGRILIFAQTCMFTHTNPHTQSCPCVLADGLGSYLYTNDTAENPNQYRR